MVSSRINYKFGKLWLFQPGLDVEALTVKVHDGLIVIQETQDELKSNIRTN